MYKTTILNRINTFPEIIHISNGTVIFYDAVLHVIEFFLIGRNLIQYRIVYVFVIIGMNHSLESTAGKLLKRGAVSAVIDIKDYIIVCNKFFVFVGLVYKESAGHPL